MTPDTDADCSKDDLRCDEAAGQINGRAFPYIGWVPCLLGSLNFGAVEVGIQTSSSGIAPINHVVHIRQQLTHVIGLPAKIDWKDFEVPGATGNFFVTLVGHREVENEEVKGFVVIFPNPAESFEKEISNSFKNLQGFIDKPLPIEAAFDDFVASTRKLAVQHGGLIFPFLLLECGLVYFNEDYLGDNISARSSISFTMAKLAYYFLKFSFHRHQHHAIETDSLITLKRNFPNNEKDVAKALVRDLSKAVVDIKRRSAFEVRDSLRKAEIQDLEQVGGIIAYARSLVTTLQANKYFDESESKIQHQYFENAGKSIEKRIAEVKLRLERQGSDFRGSYAFWYGICAVPAALLWASIALIIDPKLELSKLWQTTAAGYVAFVSIFCLAWAVWVSHNYGSRMLSSNRHASSWAARLIASRLTPPLVWLCLIAVTPIVLQAANDLLIRLGF